MKFKFAADGLPKNDDEVVNAAHQMLMHLEDSDEDQHDLENGLETFMTCFRVQMERRVNE